MYLRFTACVGHASLTRAACGMLRHWLECGNNRFADNRGTAGWRAQCGAVCRSDFAGGGQVRPVQIGHCTTLFTVQRNSIAAYGPHSTTAVCYHRGASFLLRLTGLRRVEQVSRSAGKNTGETGDRERGARPRKSLDSTGTFSRLLAG